MRIRSHHDLLVWQRAMDLVDAVYMTCRSFPSTERFGLASQLRRAAVSVPANIAEGYGRGRLGSYVNHLSIASGSLAELETELLIAARQGLIADADRSRLLDSWREVSVMLQALRASLEKRARR
jgi:four helix bundle protein